LKKQEAKNAKVPLSKNVETKAAPAVSGSVTCGNLSLKNPDQILKESVRRRDEHNARCIYLRPIPPHCTPGMLKELAREMVSCHVPLGLKNKNKGFAFLEFKNGDIAQKHIGLLSGKLFCEKPLFVAKASSQHHPSNSLNLVSLFVTGVGREVKQSDLQLLFTTAKSVKVDTAPDGDCLGTAVIEFSSEGDALYAFCHHHNKPVRGKAICVTYSLVQQPKQLQKSAATPAEQNRKRQHSESSTGSSPAKASPTKPTAEPLAKKVKTLTPVKNSESPKKALQQTKKLNTADSSDEDDDDSAVEGSSDSDIAGIQALMDSDDDEDVEASDDDEEESGDEDEDDDDSDE